MSCQTSNKLLNLEELVTSEFDNIVAVAPGDNGNAEIFRRINQNVDVKTIEFKPFLLLNSPVLLNGFNCPFEIEDLAGNAPLSHLARFTNTRDYKDSIKFLKQTTGYTASTPNGPYRVFNDFTQQLLISGCFRLFRGMTFADTHRLQFDIETLTTEGYEFTNPKRENDQIIIISMCDNRGWEHILSLDNMTEEELLRQFVDIVRERDPDILEGHNIFRFDLPFIAERAKRYNIKLSLGRNGSVMTSRSSRFTAAERSINYTRYDIYGRHIIDTYHLVQLYDVIHRDLEEYGLKAVAKHFGVAAENRTYVDAGKISDIWRNDRNRLLAYALDDVKETRSISEILSPSFFYQTQLIPLSYQNCVVRGNATRIDAMLVAEYLKTKSALPFPEAGRPFSGALTKAFESGVFQNVWHCDIRSLYPSIILAENWCPRPDTVGVFPELLKRLRTFRLQAKDSERNASSPENKDYFNSIQTTFKILINSFYGYLGFSQGTFNDFSMAEKVTSRGREILTMMLDFLQESGAKVIEMDTDGIYFQPPSSVDSTEKMEQQIQQVLPEGIEVELDATYTAMFCYKSKNYALLQQSGEVAITGAALKSRGLEPFQREYIKRFITLLLNRDTKGIEKLTQEYRHAIETREWPLEKLAKTENLNDSPETYRKKLADGKGRRSAVYELALKSSRTYRQGDQVSYYIIGNKKKVAVVENSQLLVDAQDERNENVAYYLDKLNKLYAKFSEFISDPVDADNEDPNEFKLEAE